MVERIVFMQVEDNMVTFEKENGTTIIYPLSFVPGAYTQGDIINVIVHGEEFIEFLEIDTDEMNYRRERILEKKTSLRERARRTAKA